MRRYTLTFLDGEAPVAELLLDLRIGGSVERWLWRGDERVKQTIGATLPSDDQELFMTWYALSLRGARILGLKVKEEYEGEPFPEYDRYYAPDDPTGPAHR